MTARFSLTAALTLTLITVAGAHAQLPDPLETALSATVSERTPARMALRWTVEGESVTVELLRSDDGAREYVLLEPEEDALSDGQRDVWASIRRGGRSEQADEDGAPRTRMNVGSVDFSDLRAAIGERATLERTLDDGGKVYSFAPLALPGSEDASAAMLRALRGEVIVDPSSAEIRGFRFFAAESFKPNVAARLDRFSMRQDFVHDPDLGGPRFSAMEMSLAGSAAFRRFEQSMRIELLSVDWRDEGGAGTGLGPAADSP
ncbi:hypothetical protein F1654_12905 [Alkalicaulis satelles]|uniref:DUF3108 domain-containing protein n=1 Tax=Alkalicaulis satelles TaxID=2609175 RepID=A0A5M6ZB09_9PROT|nr:hypothetical protein [Alkalicaulis satelles]KAA5800957.1 hypothetical protein F1654_12905 [Alkalicaulis satelles]